MTAYYNEFEPYAAEWLRNLIAAGHLPAGDVDTRSIVDVQPEDLKGYDQCHFFAGIGGWPLAARLAGWPDDRELWTGSCPCQPFSVAGKQKGTDDERHLWPHYFRLIRARQPAVVMGEQVAAAIGKGWLDGVFADLEGEGYACGAAGVPACAVNAPHRRDRLWFVADARDARLQGHRRPEQVDAPEGWQAADGYTAAPGGSGDVADTSGVRFAGRQNSAEGDDLDGAPTRREEGAGRTELRGEAAPGGAWHDCATIIGYDGKARRIPEPESGICLLAHRATARVGKLRAYGNAIVPQVAAEVIGAYMDTHPCFL